MIRVGRSVVRPVEVSFQKVKNFDIPTFEHALHRSTLFTNPSSTADPFADQLADVVSAELDLVAPLQTCLRRQSKPSTKWLSKEAADAKRERRRLEGVWKRHGRELNYVEYRRSCRLATKLINESRRKDHQRQLAECTNSGKMWGVAQKLLHTSDCDETRTIDENHTLCSTFSKFFPAKIEDLKHSIQAEMSSLTSSSQYPNCPFTGNLISNFLPLTPDEVSKLLLSSSTKSFRQDFITHFTYKMLFLSFFRTHFHPRQPFLLRRHLPI